MPGSDFLARLGLFTRPAFLDSGTCARILAASASSPRRPARVVDNEGKEAVAAQYRSSKRVHLPEETLSLLRSRFLDVQPELESHFKLGLTLRTPFHVLEYGPGDFFVPHIDSLAHPEGEAEERLVSAVVFLNSTCAEPSPDTYSGGSLVFYGLLKAPGADKVGFPLEAEAGLFVAFRSETLHEVKPVIHGRRFTVVSWYG